jgi:hypothetical protein
VQLLAPGLHAIDVVSGGGGGAPSLAAAGDPSLADRVGKLESEVAALRDSLRRLSQALGEADPTS